MTGKELFYIAEAKFGNMLAGDGPLPSAAINGCRRRLGAKRRC